VAQPEPFQFDYTFPRTLQEVQILGKDLTELNWRREFTCRRRFGLSWTL